VLDARYEDDRRADPHRPQSKRPGGRGLTPVYQGPSCGAG
jgi:hypothetical protein